MHNKLRGENISDAPFNDDADPEDNRGVDK